MKLETQRLLATTLYAVISLLVFSYVVFLRGEHPGYFLLMISLQFFHGALCHAEPANKP